MRPRPRWRSWLPLSTQQLRLRNLIRIEGLNIKCDDAGAIIYYTLHQNTDADAFYLSEYLTLRQELKWAEILCPRFFKTNEQSVCVKVWARITSYKSATELAKANSTHSEVTSLSALNNELPTKGHLKLMNDKMLFTWGVYFSGLIPLSRQGDIKFKDNALLFHINGDCFTSASHVVWQSPSNDSANNQELTVCQEGNKEFILPSSKYIREARSSHVCRILMETRYIQLSFKRCEVRVSYNLPQLLKLQRIQRRQLQKIKESKELTIEIQRQSMSCIANDTHFSPQTLLSSSSFSRPHQRLTMGRVLSELFSEQQQTSPYILLDAQKLKKQIELLRFKQRLLQSEYKTYYSRIGQLRDCLISLKEIRHQTQSNLESRQRQLQIEEIRLSSQYQEKSFLKQKKQKIIWDMEQRMSTLCLGLREIYPIERDLNGLNTINKVPFPGMNVFSDVKLSSDTKGIDHIMPLSLSVSLSYIAHLVQMIAVIINRPLRNAIIHHGSSSRIVDIVKEIPRSCSEFPLYSRSTLLSKSVKHAIFLLNQNVAQLCYDIAGVRCDMRLTLENIHYIFTHLADIQNVDEQKHILSHKSRNKRFALNYGMHKNVDNWCANIGNNLLSKSHSYVDINHMGVPMTLAKPENSLLQLPNSIPLTLEGACITKQRRYESFSTCRLCCQKHSLRYCNAFMAMTPDERYESVRAHKYCINCLATSHVTGACDSPDSCHKCGLAHHTLLHRQQEKPPKRQKNRRSVIKPKEKPTTRRVVTVEPKKKKRGERKDTQRRLKTLFSTAVSTLAEMQELLLPSSEQAGRHVGDMNSNLIEF